MPSNQQGASPLLLLFCFRQPWAMEDEATASTSVKGGGGSDAAAAAARPLKQLQRRKASEKEEEGDDDEDKEEEEVGKVKRLRQPTSKISRTPLLQRWRSFNSQNKLRPSQQQKQKPRARGGGGRVSPRRDGNEVKAGNSSSSRSNSSVTTGVDAADYLEVEGEGSSTNAMERKDGCANLMKIVAAEREQEKGRLDSVMQAGSGMESRKPPSFFRRGSDLVRISLRKVMVSVGGRVRNRRRSRLSRSDLPTLTTLEGVEKTKIAATGDKVGNDSQDSGLGEDSDSDGSYLRSSTRTPTPRGLQQVITTAGSSLRSSPPAISSSSSFSAKKRVVIREPNLSTLPSTQRIRSRRLEVVRIRPRAVHLLSSSSSSSSGSKVVVGSVSTQWARLLLAAKEEVAFHLPECDVVTLGLVFHPDQVRVRRELQHMEKEEEGGDLLAPLILSIYRILYFQWTTSSSSSSLSVIVHCVQRFLVVVVDVAGFAEEDKTRLSGSLGELLRYSEVTRYQDLSRCLDRTRRLYIDLWCTMLCVPFFAPARSDLLLPNVRTLKSEY